MRRKIYGFAALAALALFVLAGCNVLTRTICSSM